MTDKNFDQLPKVSSVGAADPIPLNQGGVTSSATAEQIVDRGVTGTGANAVEVGSGANASATSSTALGNTAIASAAGAVALGYGAQATAANAVALGNGVVVGAANTFGLPIGGSVGDILTKNADGWVPAAATGGISAGNPRAAPGVYDIILTSTTGGTGTLTCTAQSGSPIPSDIWTGTVFRNYTITEWADATKKVVVQRERGYGGYNTSTEVLTRTKVLSTWVASGTTFLPADGVATAPTALNFGTTAANIDIAIEPMLGNVIPPIPFVSGTVASVSDGLGTVPFNAGAINASITPGSGTVIYVPILITHQGPFSQFSIRTTTTLTGGSSTYDCAIYEIGSDGLPGKRLINFTQLTAIGTANTTYTSTALATPVYLTPGWYYVAGLYVAGGASGTFTARGFSFFAAGPQGTFLSNATSMAGALTVTSQTALNDPATAPTGTLNSSNVIAHVFK